MTYLVLQGYADIMAATRIWKIHVRLAILLF